MPTPIQSELTPNSAFQSLFNNNQNPGALVDIGLIRGAFKVFDNASDFVDDDGNNVFANVGLFSNNQIIYAQDTNKLYQFSEEIVGGPQFDINGNILFVNGDPLQGPIILEASPAKWDEFTFSGDPTGVSDPLSIGSLTVNDGGFGTTLELQDDSTLNITAQSANTILNIESSSLGLSVDSRGLLELDAFDYTPTPNDGNLLFSGSAYYVGTPDPLNLLSQTLTSVGANSFNYTSQDDTYDISSLSGTTTKVYSNYNVSDCYAGQIFLITFTIGGTPNDTSIYIMDESDAIGDELSNFQSISSINVGTNSIKISPNHTGNMKIVFATPGEASYTITNLKLIKLSI